MLYNHQEHCITTPNYQSLRWYLILIIAIHNFEEWLTFPHYAQEIVNTFAAEFNDAVQLPGRTVIELALVLSTLVPISIIIWASLGHQKFSKNLLVCIIAGIFFANVFMPHMAAAALTGGYTPGLVSALALVFPFCLLIWRQAWREHVLSFNQIVAAASFGAIVLLPSILLIFFTSKFLHNLTYLI